MQIEKYNLSNLPKELIKEICIPHLFYKSYTALACCTKRFNEIAKEHSIIYWPIKITPLKELKGVTYAIIMWAAKS